MHSRKMRDIYSAYSRDTTSYNLPSARNAGRSLIKSDVRSGGNTRRYGGWRLGCHTLLRPSRPVTLVVSPSSSALSLALHTNLLPYYTYILTSNSQPTCPSPQPTSPPVRPVLRIHLCTAPDPLSVSSLLLGLESAPVMLPVLFVLNPRANTIHCILGGYPNSPDHFHACLSYFTK